MIGTVVDNYLVQEVLGRGGMGIVYKAVDMSLDKVVALKVMDSGLNQDDHFLQRFKVEARALGRLQHPHIVNVLAFRYVEPHLLMVTEYIEGGTLKARISQGGPLPWQTAVPMMRQALSAIDYAHRQRIIHRDIKPANILLTRTSAVKITDFGLAKIQAAQGPGRSATRTDFTAGTLCYMSPEQLEGLSKVDHRGDIYALGMTFYEMLAGTTPFHRRASDFAIQQAIYTHDFPALDQLNKEVPAPLVRIVMKAIEREPADRYPSAHAMLEVLTAWETQAVRQATNKTTAVSGVRGRSRSRETQPTDPYRSPAKRRFGGTRGLQILPMRPRLLQSAAFAGGVLLLSVLFGLNRQRGAEAFPVMRSSPHSSATAFEPSSPADLPKAASLLADPTQASPTTEAVRQTEPVTEKNERTLPALLLVDAQEADRKTEPVPSALSAPESEEEVELVKATEGAAEARLDSIGTETDQAGPLTPLTGTLRLKPSPWGNVYVDGEPYAYEVDYWIVLNLSARLHRITVRNPVFDRIWEMDIVPTPGDTQDVAIDFMARLDVNVSAKDTDGHPVSGEIYVDGNPTGDWSPMRIQVYPGLHRIEVRKAGYTQVEVREVKGEVVQRVELPINFSQGTPARIFHVFLRKTE